MVSALEEFLSVGVLAFMLSFVRIGTAVMIMPGLGDTFTPQRVRLVMAVAMSLVIFPLIVKYIPDPLPNTTLLLLIIMMEFVVGLFFGTVARTLMMALDTAGMVISTSSGLANAQVFNPSLATQGSLVGALLSVAGIVILFSLNMHHLLIMGVVESYELFPLGQIPDTGSMAQFLTGMVSRSFMIGVKIGSPFIMLTLLIYVGMGVLSRLMPQVQVFLLALPVQVLLSLMLMMLVMSFIFAYWSSHFEDSLVFFLSIGG